MVEQTAPENDPIIPSCTCGGISACPTCQDADAETAELIEEWRRTCQSVGIPFRMEDAIKFVEGAR